MDNTAKPMNFKFIGQTAAVLWFPIGIGAHAFAKLDIWPSPIKLLFNYDKIGRKCPTVQKPVMILYCIPFWLQKHHFYRICTLPQWNGWKIWHVEKVIYINFLYQFMVHYYFLTDKMAITHLLIEALPSPSPFSASSSSSASSISLPKGSELIVLTLFRTTRLSLLAVSMSWSWKWLNLTLHTLE